MKTVNAYRIYEHPDKNKVFDWIRNNWHDLNDHTIREVIDSLKALRDRVGGELDYSISAVPDRGEYVTLKGYDPDDLKPLIDSIDDYPLTGVCWDYDVIEGLRYGELEYRVLKAIHAETEYLYSDEALEEFCEANEYYFFENGHVS